MSRNCLSPALNLLLLSWLLLALMVGSRVAQNSSADNSSVPKLPLGESRIVGGTKVEISDFPYQLSLRVKTRHICGASIVSEEWAVTAAHCCDGSVSAMSLRAGSTDRKTGGAVYLVAKKILHERYNYRTMDYDIALLKVSQPFKYSSTVQNITLLTTLPKAGVMAHVSGWGTTSSGGTSPTLLYAVSVPLVSKSSCQSSYGRSSITERMICAGYPKGGKDSCQGDSGGPLVIEVSGAKQLIGVVSWGKGCAAPRYPGVYASVPSLRAWIKEKSNVSRI